MLDKLSSWAPNVLICLSVGHAIAYMSSCGNISRLEWFREVQSWLSEQFSIEAVTCNLFV